VLPGSHPATLAEFVVGAVASNDGTWLYTRHMDLLGGAGDVFRSR
jgi:hypothetical protein